MSSRDEVLARIRDALGAVPRPDVPVLRAYRTEGESSAGAPELVDLFIERVADYRAGVRRATVQTLPSAVAEALSAGLQQRETALANNSDRARLVVPQGLDASWLAALDAEVIQDGHLAETFALGKTSHLLIANMDPDAS